MTEKVEDLAWSITSRILHAVNDCVVCDDHGAWLEDPVFEGLRRNRVIAETIKTLARLPGNACNAHGFTPKVRQGLLDALLHRQLEDGTWEEIHPRYREPGALVTAFSAEALLEAAESPRYPLEDPDTVEAALEAARDAILERELEPGFFLKSEEYRADHLNVDVSCGAFLAQYADARNDKQALDAATRAAENTIHHQRDDGAYPYTTGTRDDTYPHPLRIPCIHYQGVTGHFLAKIHKLTGDHSIKRSLIQAADWFLDTQRSDGSLDWTRSQLKFPWYVTGAYAFGASLCTYTGQWKKEHQSRVAAALNHLDEMVPALAWRWEPSELVSFPRGIHAAYQTADVPGYPLKERCLRFGYGLYRELARRRSSGQVEDRLFRVLQRSLNLPASTVDPSHNYPDLFMSSEIADCLSATIRPNTGFRTIVNSQVIQK